MKMPRLTIRRMMLFVAVAAAMSAYSVYLWRRYAENFAKPHSEPWYNPWEHYAVFLAAYVAPPMLAVAFGAAIVWCIRNRPRPPRLGDHPLPLAPSAARPASTEIDGMDEL